ncbi:MAG: phosphate ABC transporter permease subunit PstC [Spirochaetaceae bacterium]|jgi:phosphate transport system permease protein|nr:phosphate ABC transporter permease subunit PstC [Spirochaetaceae bacterium]
MNTAVQETRAFQVKQSGSFNAGGALQIRKRVDYFFTVLFTVTSFFSVLALGAILLFVFVQGAEPFFFATSQGIELVTERIDELFINGELHRNEDKIILPEETDSLSIRFNSGTEERLLEFALNPEEKDPDKMLSVITNETGNLSSPQAFVYTTSFPGINAALPQKIHLILPEPRYGFFNFLSGLEWRPTHKKVYGIFPMIAGTVLASLGAVLLGVPIALLVAVFLAEFLPEKIAAPVRACIELLAGIPSVVYGFFGLMILSPAVKQIFGTASGNCLLSAIVVLTVMILPTVISIAETSLRAVPQAQREASLALGASKMQTSWRVVLVHARSGVIAGIILGISRAIGETMAVILVAGNSVQMINSPLDSVRTLTATIALEMGYAQGRHGSILFSIGVVLFVLILSLNSAILFIRHREVS